MSLSEKPLYEAEDECGVHALVIGVGKYDYPEQLRSINMSLQDIESASSNALAFANWLMEDAIDEVEYVPTVRTGVATGLRPKNIQKLASLELLCDTETIRVQGKPSEVKRGTKDNIAKALRGWVRRVQERPGENIGVFYFSGHGFSANGSQLLCPADLGSGEFQFSQAIDFTKTRIALKTSGENSQVYFIDSCRSKPDGRLERVATGEVLWKYDRWPSKISETPTFFACQDGKEATGNHLGYFTQALMDVLEGAGAMKDHTAWDVLLTHVTPPLAETTQWHQQSDEAVAPQIPVHEDIDNLFPDPINPIHSSTQPSNVYFLLKGDGIDEFELSDVAVYDGEQKLFLRSGIGFADELKGTIPRNVVIEISRDGLERRIINREFVHSVNKLSFRMVLDEGDP